MELDPKKIKCIVFDFANTLYSGVYFNLAPCGCQNWRELFDTYVFDGGATESNVMNGQLGTEGIAEIISEHVGLDAESAMKLMHQGCKNLEFNPAIFDFAIEQNNKGTTTALVTINMDVFTTTVVSAHGLGNIFDVIVNSFDHKETRKNILWDVAFSKLNSAVTFSNSLLVDDRPDNVSLFKELGGHAYQYQDDKSFLEWLNSTGFNRD